MSERFYIDTAIWIDFYEDRKGFKGEPLGDWAMKLFSLIMARKNKIVISDFLICELEMNYSIAEINGMMKVYEKFVEKVVVNKKQRDKSINIAQNRQIPKGDALHAIIARDNNLIMITRDNHFKELLNITNFHKPEDLI